MIYFNSLVPVFFNPSLRLISCVTIIPSFVTFGNPSISLMTMFHLFGPMVTLTNTLIPCLDFIIQCSNSYFFSKEPISLSTNPNQCWIVRNRVTTSGVLTMSTSSEIRLEHNFL